MNILKVLNDPQWWRSLLGSDFNQGFMAALALILGLMVILFIIRSIVKFIFRTRRCNAVTVKRQDGDTLISKDVIAGVIERELADYPALRHDKIVLTRRGSSYQVTIYCDYLLSDQSGIPAFCDEFKPRLCDALKKSFGIVDLTKVKLWIVSSGGNTAEGTENDVRREENSYIGL